MSPLSAGRTLLIKFDIFPCQTSEMMDHILACLYHPAGLSWFPVCSDLFSRCVFSIGHAVCRVSANFLSSSARHLSPRRVTTVSSRGPGRASSDAVRPAAAVLGAALHTNELPSGCLSRVGKIRILKPPIWRAAVAALTTASPRWSRASGGQVAVPASRWAGRAGLLLGSAHQEADCSLDWLQALNESVMLIG